MTRDEALAQLEAAAEPGRAEGMAAYHKAPRRYLGVPNPALNDITKAWRKALPGPARVALADALWQTDIFEARLAAAKLLTQARMRPDDNAAWELIMSWVPDFDSWAIADHAMTAGQKRLVADPARIETVESWTHAQSHWTRRAAMVVTLPFAKQNHPSEAGRAIRERVLGWADAYVRDPDWFIQKSVAWWLRDLSKHDPDRVRAFMAENGRYMKPFARKEAEKHLPPR
ncbi:DNA alkylation repair protein [Lutimaribacter sp. EGI FJ00015]|uniref:DNA alkylation repair protein n=1 Tax=Lutimaribacter degradans TaxID=2945989 RepID=A0ACC5ZR90_9RHOB|nr:DNA alkylation repair protein [Lutimaribacter sp. EGI FJ00013]MCM2560842.1 DNA alkylation repair protein [Lutimaribacter sp. EGI FJ00013]MCO0612213.1 DNA alkylation repair protein [Lutimaribacter sp. EGI FJ00015]MCO0634667.1 DNA alkylation repair protein [Lutimaribacter sp. EGI FJ00014]